MHFTLNWVVVSEDSAFTAAVKNKCEEKILKIDWKLCEGWSFLEISTSLNIDNSMKKSKSPKIKLKGKKMSPTARPSTPCAPRNPIGPGGP